MGEHSFVCDVSHLRGLTCQTGCSFSTEQDLAREVAGRHREGVGGQLTRLMYELSHDPLSEYAMGYKEWCETRDMYLKKWGFVPRGA